MIDTIARWWCRRFHPRYKLSRPIRGKSVCLICLCVYDVPWDRSVREMEKRNRERREALLGSM